MTQPKTALVVLGDILKHESDRMSRQVVPAPKGTKMGDLVDYPPRKKKLVALSDEQGGKVLVQPHNCTINLDYVNLGSVKADTLIKDGDGFGIKYIGKATQKTSGRTESSGDGHSSSGGVEVDRGLDTGIEDGAGSETDGLGTR